MAETADQAIDAGGIVATIAVDASPTMTHHTRAHLGMELRSIYADLCETQPITDMQVDLLLRMRHKERDRRRAA